MKESRRGWYPPGTWPIRRRLMEEARITRPSPPSTRTIVANEGFCRQVAALLMCDRAPILDAFIGEPAQEVLVMVRWALSHENDEGFDSAEVLTSWAKKRGRGTWSGRPRRPEHNSDGELTWALANFWAKHPRELAQLLERVQASINANNGRS
jgi:hypothetical protein